MHEQNILLVRWQVSIHTEQIPSRNTTRYTLTSPTIPSSMEFKSSSLKKFRTRSRIF